MKKQADRMMCIVPVETGSSTINSDGGRNNSKQQPFVAAALWVRDGVAA